MKIFPTTMKYLITFIRLSVRAARNIKNTKYKTMNSIHKITLKIIIIILVNFSSVIFSQITANRFFYELTYKPSKDYITSDDSDYNAILYVWYYNDFIKLYSMG